MTAADVGDEPGAGPSEPVWPVDGRDEGGDPACWAHLFDDTEHEVAAGSLTGVDSPPR